MLFDGRSLAAWPNGDVVIAPAWEEGILLIDVNDSARSQWIPMKQEESGGLTQLSSKSVLEQDEETVL